MNKVRRRALALILILMRMRMTSEKTVRKRYKNVTRRRKLVMEMASVDLNAKPPKRTAALLANELIAAACEEMRINKRLGSGRIFVRRSVRRVPDEADYPRDFEVEKVLSSKGVGADKMYLVKWVGYTQSTWEPAAHLDNCDERIDDYDPGFDEIISDGE